MRLSIIAALGKNFEIGQDGKLPWKNLPDDLQNFKKLTDTHTVIMGRRTFESIGHPLSNRTNIIVSTTSEPSRGILIAHTLEESLKLIPTDETETFLIGGNGIYKAGLLHADRMYLTMVDATFPNADVFFPKFDPLDWNIETVQSHEIDGRHQFPYKVCIFDRLSRERK